MLLTKKSAFTGRMHTMDLPITEEELHAYETGSCVIQNFFPHLNADQREFIMTGVTKEEWDATFGSQDDDE